MGGAIQRRVLALGLSMAAVAAVSLSAGTAAGEATGVQPVPIRGTLLQLGAAHTAWEPGDFDRLGFLLQALGADTVVVQWTRYGEADVDVGVLGLLFAAAERHGLGVVVGTIYEPRFEEWIRRDPERAGVSLRRLASRTADLVAAWAPEVVGRRAFAGWYVPQEIDDVHWLEPARRALLQEYLTVVAETLRAAAPGAPIAVSGFSNGQAAPDTLEDLWRTVLASGAVDRVYFQDGIGARKQRLDELPLYLAAVGRAAAAAGVALMPIVELFEQTDGSPVGDGPFRARPAPPARVARQLAAAGAVAPTGTLLFSVPDYADPRGERSAASLFELLRTGLAAADEAEASEPAPATIARRSPAPPAVPPTPRAGGAARVYEVQIGLYHHRSHAEAAVAASAAQGREVFIVEVWSSRGEVRFTVRFGPYPSLAAAAAAAAAYREATGEDALVRYRVPG